MGTRTVLGGYVEDNAFHFLGLGSQNFHPVISRYTDYTVSSLGHFAYSLIKYTCKEVQLGLWRHLMSRNKNTVKRNWCLLVALRLGGFGSSFLQTNVAGLSPYEAPSWQAIYNSHILILIPKDATLHSLFISGNCSTCFGCYLHPSSGAHTTVSTASGTCQTVTATCRYRGGIGTVDTVVCTPDDWWR